MAIELTCNSCGKRLKTKDSAAGKNVKCPSCGAVNMVPDAPPPAAAPGGVFDAEESPFGDLGDLGGQGQPISNLPTSSGRKPCPMCGEMIQEGAAKCRFCGEIFDPALKKTAKASAGGADDDLSTGDWVVAILCSGIGCIAGIVWMIQGKKKGLKMFGVSLAMQFFWGVVRVIIETAARQ